MRHNCLRSTESCIQFGLSDLVLRGDFSDCSAELEATYGIGLRPDEAKTFLAGATSFRAEAVEIWAVSAAPEQAGSVTGPMQ